MAQKRIVRAARQRGIPVVVATQMLESMISAPAPTRAEASDVATAVYDGADAVMLSAETAAGQYPYESVNMMDRIIDRVEQDPYWRDLCETGRPAPEQTVADAIADAARQISRTIGARAIAALHHVRFHRPCASRAPAPTAQCSASPPTSSRPAAWPWCGACTPWSRAETHTMTETVTRASRIARTEGFAAVGESVVVAAGVPFGQAGTTNALRVVSVR